MNRLAMVESIQNFFDCGIFMESFKNALKVKMEMGLKDFMGHLLFGKGYIELTPPNLSEQLERNPDLLIVDLRDRKKFKKQHISGAVSHPFDDFLKSILVDRGYREFNGEKIVLVCDTGHQSRVAASIMTGEGFKHIASLNRGIRRWKKWQNLLHRCRDFKNNRVHICKLI